MHLRLCIWCARLQLSKPALHCKLHRFTALGMHCHHACLRGFLLLWGMRITAPLRKEDISIDLQRWLQLWVQLLPLDLYGEYLGSCKYEGGGCLSSHASGCPYRGMTTIILNTLQDFRRARMVAGPTLLLRRADRTSLFRRS